MVLHVYVSDVCMGVIIMDIHYREVVALSPLPQLDWEEKPSDLTCLTPQPGHPEVYMAVIRYSNIQ